MSKSKQAIEKARSAPTAVAASVMKMTVERSNEAAKRPPVVVPVRYVERRPSDGLTQVPVCIVQQEPKAPACFSVRVVERPSAGTRHVPVTFVRRETASLPRKTTVHIVSHVRTIDIVNGVPVPDVSGLDLAASNGQRQSIQARLGQINAADPKRQDTVLQGERRQLVATLGALDAHVRDLRQREGEEKKRRAFAGIGTPLHEAIVATLDIATVGRLEADAIRRLAERVRRNAERRAANLAPKTNMEVQKT